MLVYCLLCGKEIHRKASYLKRRPHSFCNSKCYKKYVKQHKPSVKVLCQTLDLKTLKNLSNKDLRFLLGTGLDGAAYMLAISEYLKRRLNS